MICFCSEPCTPGTFSLNGLAPCKPCPTGTYQQSYEGKQCNKCPGSTTTTNTATDSLSACGSKYRYNQCENIQFIIKKYEDKKKVLDIGSSFLWPIQEILLQTKNTIFENYI